jgi:hypothetical protein
MLSSLSFKPTPSHGPNPSTGSSIRISLICLLAVLAICLAAATVQPAQASSGSLPLGSVQLQSSNVYPCPGGQWLYPETYCSAAVLTGCPNVQDLDFAFGYQTPSGTPKGVIVYFDGGDGTSPSGEATEVDMLGYYVSQGYVAVQVAWGSPWQQVLNPWPISSTPQGNIQNAACRPATFLNYIYNTVYLPIAKNFSNAGMCAQGFSAGSAAIGYSLAYYGAGSYLDNVELISGPVLSDIKQGCEVPGPPTLVTVCPSGQLGCQLGSGTSWTLPATYVLNGATYLGNWTNDNSCVGSSATSSPSNARWLAQSIVDQNTGATPTFNYPSTAMGAWLCRSLQNQRADCSGSNYNYNVCPNNSSTQGEIFYSQITSANAPPAYGIYAVDNCYGPEGAPQGNVGSPTGPSGETKIEQDMAGPPGVPPGQCFHRTH